MERRYGRKFMFVVTYQSPTETGRCVSETFDRLEHSTTNAAHGKGSSAIVHNPKGAWLTGILSHDDTTAVKLLSTKYTKYALYLKRMSVMHVEGWGRIELRRQMCLHK